MKHIYTGKQDWKYYQKEAEETDQYTMQKVRYNDFLNKI